MSTHLSANTSPVQCSLAPVNKNWFLNSGLWVKILQYCWNKILSQFARVNGNVLNIVNSREQYVMAHRFWHFVICGCRMGYFKMPSWYLFTNNNLYIALLLCVSRRIVAFIVKNINTIFFLHVSLLNLFLNLKIFFFFWFAPFGYLYFL